MGTLKLAYPLLLSLFFTLIYLACTLNAHEDNHASKNDDSPKDSAEIASDASPKNPSNGRIIRPSAWSKEEERELKRNNGRNTFKEDQNLLLEEQFSLLNIKKFFRYITSLLYDVDENNDVSWKKATNNVVLKMHNLRSNNLSVKAENNVNDEMQIFRKSEAPGKSADDTQFHNSSTPYTPNKLPRMQNQPNNGSLNIRQLAKSPNFKTQNFVDTQDNEEMQNSPANNPQNEPSNNGNEQKSSNNKQPTKMPRLGTQNSNNKDSTEKSENNMKTQTQNLASTDSQDNGEMQNFPNKPSNDKNNLKMLLKLSFNNKQPTVNSRLEIQNSNDKDVMNESENNMETETQNIASTNTQDDGKMKNSSNKPSSDGNAQKSSDKYSSNHKQPTENPELETENSNDKDFTNNSKNNMKTDTQNPDESNILNKSETGGEMQNFSTNDSLNKPSGNETIQNSSNNNSSNSRQSTKNLEESGSQQNSMKKDNLNKAAQNTTMQNPKNKNNRLKSISTLKSGKLKEDLTETVFKDYDECETREVTLDDNTTEYTPTEKVKKYEDNDKEEDNDKDDTDENDINENETENDYINSGTDINENDIKKNDVEDGNENDVNENDVEDGNENDVNENDIDDDNLKENNYDGDENKPDTDNQNSQPAVIAQEKVDDTHITLPKFIIQTIQNQQNYSETHPPKIQIDNNDNAASESVKSQKITNEEKLFPEFQLSSNEFMDDYINNRQGQNPQRANEQASNMKAFNPNGSDGMNKKNLLSIPIFLNKFKKDYVPLNPVPTISETMKHQNMPFNQSQITEDNFWRETNTVPLPAFNEDRKGSNRNQVLPNKTFSQNLPHTYTSVDKPVFATEENIKSGEVTPQKLIPFQQTPYINDLQDKFATPKKDYNTFTQPAILGIQDTTPSVQTFHSDVPATDEYKPDITNSFQTYPNKSVPLQSEGYLNDEHENYKFQDEKSSAINNESNQQFVQKKPTVLQPGMFPNAQYTSNQDTPHELGKKTYYTNYKPEMPDNVPNVEKPESNTDMFSNHMISDVLQPNPSFNQIHNQDSSPTGTENNMDKNMSQDQLNTIKPQNQSNNVQTLNPQILSENQPLQDKFPGKQQNEMNNRILPDKNKISSDRIPAQDETENTELPLRQKDTKNLKEVPRHVFNITEDNLQVKSENEDSPSVIPESVAPKSQSPQAKSKSSKPLIDERQKNSTFDQTEDQDEEVSNSGTNSNKNEIEIDYLSENNYDNENKTNEDEYQDEAEENDDDDEDEDEDEDEDDYDEIQDDYVRENNYDSGDKANEDEIEDEDEDEKKEEDESKDDDINENKYDHDETETSSNSHQTKSDQQNHSITQPPTSHDNIKSEVPKSQGMTNKENPSSVFELGNNEFNDNYNNDDLGENPIKVEEPTSFSDETVNDTTMQITQNPTYGDTNGVALTSEISKSESPSSNQEGSFDTILEYVYKYSNNPLFKGIREEKN